MGIGWLVPVLNLLGMGGGPVAEPEPVTPGRRVEIPGADRSRVTTSGYDRSRITVPGRAEG